MDLTNSMTWIILVGALGLPSAVVSIMTNRIIRKMNKAEEVREEKEKKRIEHQTLFIELIMASLGLAEVTAEAIQRIPDTHCNGEMKEALESAKSVQEKYRKFEREQTAESIVA